MDTQTDLQWAHQMSRKPVQEIPGRVALHLQRQRTVKTLSDEECTRRWLLKAVREIEYWRQRKPDDTWRDRFAEWTALEASRSLHAYRERTEAEAWMTVHQPPWALGAQERRDTLETGARFVRALFGTYDKGWIEIRGLKQRKFDPTGRDVLRRWYSLPEMLQDPTPMSMVALGWARKQYDVYVGVLPRGVQGKSDKGHIFEAGTAWAELDFDKSGGEAETVRRALAAGPDILVRSGGGLHLYWRFERPVCIADNEDRRSRFERSLHRRQSGLGGDPIHDCTRILRFPGTWNFKQDTPRKVILERCR